MVMPVDDSPVLSIIIPTLNEAAGLGKCVASLFNDAPQGAFEIIVADAGSDDGTSGEAGRLGCSVVNSPKGRGLQLAAGASEAKADWLLFVHADTWLASGWWGAVKEFMDGPENLRHAAAFRFRLDDDGWAASILQSLVGMRCRYLSMPFGDQGLLISRAFYNDLGGFQPMPLMEDVDMARRIGGKSLSMLDIDAVTSGVRYRRDGYLIRGLRNLLCLGLYFIGVSPRLIAKVYG